MIEALGLVAASSYAADIDFVFDLIFWIVVASGSCSPRPSSSG